MDGCTAIIFVKHVKLVLSKLALFVLHDSIAGEFHNKATVGASALHWVQWQNLDGDSFDMLYKNDCWAAIPNPIWMINISYERKINMLWCTYISFVISLFNFEKYLVKPGFSFTQLNRANTQNLEKVNVDMFYKNYCWAVICHPICVTTVSYEREIIVLSLPVISFVIRIVVFQRFDIKSGGFLSIDSHCIGSEICGTKWRTNSFYSGDTVSHL